MCDLFMYNLYPDYFPKGEKKRWKELKFIENPLCNKLHGLRIFSSVPPDNGEIREVISGGQVKHTRLRKVKANSLAMQSPSLTLCFDSTLPSPMASSSPAWCIQKDLKDWATQSQIK